MGSEVDSRRLDWIDWAKVIGAWLVIVGHLNFSTAIINCIFSFHMPLFFFLSGYLDKGEPIKATFRKSLQTLLIPYLLLYLVTYPAWLVEAYLRHTELYHNGFFLDAIIKPLAGMFLAVGYDTEVSTMTNIPLWFLVGLFWTKIINAIVIALANGRRWCIYIANLVIIGFVLFIKMTAVDLWFSFDSALLAYPLFSMGYLLKNRYAAVSRAGIFVATGFALLLTFALSSSNGRVDINNFNFGKNIWLFYGNGFVGLMSVVGLSCLLAGRLKNICMTLSAGTLLIVAFHSIMGSIIYKAVLYCSEGKSIAQYVNIDLLVSILVMAAMYPVIILTMKYFPVLIGGRGKNTAVLEID